MGKFDYSLDLGSDLEKFGDIKKEDKEKNLEKRETDHKLSLNIKLIKLILSCYLFYY